MAREKGEIEGPAASGPWPTDGAQRADREVGAVLGDPDGFRVATGRKNIDVRGVAREMLRNVHERDDD